MYSTLDICISDHTTFHGNTPSGIYTAIPTGNVVHVSAQCVPISLFLSIDWFLRDHDYDRMYKIGDVSEFFWITYRHFCDNHKANGLILWFTCMLLNDKDELLRILHWQLFSISYPWQPRYGCPLWLGAFGLVYCLSRWEFLSEQYTDNEGQHWH